MIPIELIVRGGCFCDIFFLLGSFCIWRSSIYFNYSSLFDFCFFVFLHFSFSLFAIHSVQLILSISHTLNETYRPAAGERKKVALFIVVERVSIQSKSIKLSCVELFSREWKKRIIIKKKNNNNEFVCGVIARFAENFVCTSSVQPKKMFQYQNVWIGQNILIASTPVPRKRLNILWARHMVLLFNTSHKNTRFCKIH